MQPKPFDENKVFAALTKEWWAKRKGIDGYMPGPPMQDVGGEVWYACGSFGVRTTMHADVLRLRLEEEADTHKQHALRREGQPRLSEVSISGVLAGATGGSPYTIFPTPLQVDSGDNGPARIFVSPDNMQAWLITTRILSLFGDLDAWTWRSKSKNDLVIGAWEGVDMAIIMPINPSRSHDDISRVAMEIWPDKCGRQALEAKKARV